MPDIEFQTVPASRPAIWHTRRRRGPASSSFRSVGLSTRTSAPSAIGCGEGFFALGPRPLPRETPRAQRGRTEMMALAMGKAEP